MDYQTFKTRTQAKAALTKMKGWSASIIQLYMPHDENANKSGNCFILKADGMYLRTDGYIR